MEPLLGVTVRKCPRQAEIPQRWEQGLCQAMPSSGASAHSALARTVLTGPPELPRVKGMRGGSMASSCFRSTELCTEHMWEKN